MPRKSIGGSRSKLPAVASQTNAIPTSFPGNEGIRGMDEPVWLGCRDMLESVYKAKDGNRLMSEIFQELPDKEEYADYYLAIPEPECLDNIGIRLGEQGFPNPELFFKQLHLVFLNAKYYNEEDSQIYTDALAFEKLIFETWRARAADGIFAFPDPYHHKSRSGSVPNRKSRPVPAVKKEKIDNKVAEVKTKAPAPAKVPSLIPPSPPAQASKPTIHLRVTRPEPEVHAIAKGKSKAGTTTTTPPVAAAVPSPARKSPVKSAATTKPVPASKVTVLVNLDSTPKSAPTPTPTPARAPEPSTPDLPGTATSVLTPSPGQTAMPKASTLTSLEVSLTEAVDATIPRWEGPRAILPGDPAPGGVPGSGWWGEGAPEFERQMGGSASWKKRIKGVVEAVAAYKDHRGLRLADVFGQLPPLANVRYLSFSTAVSFSQILQSARTGRYNTLRDFDLDMVRLFEKARRWFQSRSDEYGRILTLQRLYHALTAPYPLTLPPMGVPAPSATRFASLPAGPGSARSMEETAEALRAGKKEVGYGITSSRIGTKDRVFTDEARHKGVSYRAGDYVHLINPDDPSKPIIGQIWKSFVPTKGYATHHVTVCWYFRPEQTVHTSEQMFVDNEVLKTGQFCDHPVEDIIERVTVQAYDSYIRGRLRPPAYYPGWPIYPCRRRYIDRAWFFLEIKRWSSIGPEESRKTNPTFLPFARPLTLPLLKSPFTRGIHGPGFLSAPKRPPASGDDEDEEAAAVSASIAIHRPRPPHTPMAGYPQTPSSGPSRVAASPSFPSATRPGAAANVASPSPAISGPRTSATSLTGQAWPPQSALFPNRTFAAIMGGPQVLEQVAVKEYLPQDTARLFEQDARHQVLWFSGPPLPQGALKIPTQPRHSLDYLAFLTKRKHGETIEDARPRKRRSEEEERSETGNAGGVEEAGDGEGDLARFWWAKGQTEEQVFTNLRAVVEA